MNTITMKEYERAVLAFKEAAYRIECPDCGTTLYSGPILLGFHFTVSCSCGYVLDCVIGENK